jgi:hypothetical protein
MLSAARLLVHVSLFYTCIEGLVINILYPATLPYIYKDFAILAVYVLLVLEEPTHFFSPSPTAGRVILPMLLFGATILFFMLMPGGMGMGSLVAVKQRLFYLPMLMAAYRFIRSERDLMLCFGVLAIYAIAVSLFGIYLYYAGPEGLRRLGANYSAEIATSAGPTGTQQYWRVPGTFNSPGQYGSYLFFNGLVATALLLNRSTPRALRTIAATATVLIVLAIFVSGSRTPLLVLSASAAILILNAGHFGKLVTWSIVGYAVFAFGVVFLGIGIRERFASIASYEHITRFQATYFGQMVVPALLQQPFGRGLGTATIGARHFGEWSEVDLVESYIGMLAVETGWLGVLTFLWLAAAVVFVIWKLRPFMRGSIVHELWLAMAIYVVISLALVPISTGPDHAPTNFYLWFALGAIVRLADLHALRLWSSYAQQQQTPATPQWAPQPQSAFGPLRSR